MIGELLKEAWLVPKLQLSGQLSAGVRQFLQLRRLLLAASDTRYGQVHDFRRLVELMRWVKPEKEAIEDLLLQVHEVYSAQAPIVTYEQMYQSWWCKVYEDGAVDVCWPGRISKFALSSGTSQDSNKRIPVSNEMIANIKKTSLRQLKALFSCGLPASYYTTSVFTLAGRRSFFSDIEESDISSIIFSQLPFWLHLHSKMSLRVADMSMKDKLDLLVREAPRWRIGTLVGSVTWLQVLLRKIVTHYQVDTIHDVWKDLSVCIHGGTAFTPHKRAYDSLSGRPMIYLESYLASEGYIAYQRDPSDTAMTHALQAGVFFEYLPFDATNFDQAGRFIGKTKPLTIQEVALNTPYSLVLSTCAGAWRYLIGDVIRFTSLGVHPQLVIEGRNQHFVSTFGEHLSLNNLDTAIAEVADQLGLLIEEYTLYAQADTFDHHWFIGVRQKSVEVDQVRACLDAALQRLNMDYSHLRKHAIRLPQVHLLVPSYFYEWLAREKKDVLGPQAKFPRVLTGSRIVSWKAFLQQHLQVTF